MPLLVYGTGDAKTRKIMVELQTVSGSCPTGRIGGHAQQENL